MSWTKSVVVCLLACVLVGVEARYFFSTFSYTRLPSDPLFVTFFSQQAWRYNSSWLTNNATTIDTPLVQLSLGDGSLGPTEMKVLYITGNGTNDYMMLAATWNYRYTTSYPYVLSLANTCCMTGMIDLTIAAGVNPLLITPLPIYSLVVGTETLIVFPTNYNSIFNASFVSSDTSGLSTTAPPGSSYFAGRTLAFTPTTAGIFRCQIVFTHEVLFNLSTPVEITFNVSATSTNTALLAPIALNTSELFDGYNISGGSSETLFVTVRGTVTDGRPAHLYTSQPPDNTTITDCSEGVSSNNPTNSDLSITSTCTITVSYVPGAPEVNREVAFVNRDRYGALSPVTLYRFKIVWPRPVITLLNPSSGVTGGGAILTVGGMFFGTTGDLVANTVQVNGSGCGTPIFSGGNILCIVPPGQGLKQPVTVTFFGRKSFPVGLNYSAPILTSISRTSATTEGGLSFVLGGTAFGKWNQIVTIGGLVQTLVSSSGLGGTVCTTTMTPAQGGALLPVIINVSGQINSAVKLFNYTVPSITAVTAVTGQASTLGGFTITIDGLNFGTDGNTISATIGSQPCTTLTHDTSTNPHRRLFCVAPAGIGKVLPVGLTVMGQSAFNPLITFSYSLPTISGVGPPQALLPGLLFTIDGANFGPTSSTGAIALDGNSGGVAVVTWNDIQITGFMGTFVFPPGSNTLQITVAGQVGPAFTFMRYIAPSSGYIPPSSSTGSSAPSSSSSFSSSSQALSSSATSTLFNCVNNIWTPDAALISPSLVIQNNAQQNLVVLADGSLVIRAAGNNQGIGVVWNATLVNDTHFLLVNTDYGYYLQQPPLPPLGTVFGILVYPVTTTLFNTGQLFIQWSISASTTANYYTVRSSLGNYLTDEMAPSLFGVAASQRPFNNDNIFTFLCDITTPSSSSSAAQAPPSSSVQESSSGPTSSSVTDVLASSTGPVDTSGSSGVDVSGPSTGSDRETSSSSSSSSSSTGRTNITSSSSSSSSTLSVGVIAAIAIGALVGVVVIGAIITAVVSATTVTTTATIAGTTLGTAVAGRSDFGY